MSTQLELLRARRFLPLFGSQILGAFNDNLFKSALVMMVTFGTDMNRGLDPATISALAGGALIAPYFLFSATAGELADRYERSWLMKVLKAGEIAIVTAAAATLITHSLVLSMITLFLLGCQATFTGPSKYALLPQYLRPPCGPRGNDLRDLRRQIFTMNCSPFLSDCAKPAPTRA